MKRKAGRPPLRPIGETLLIHVRGDEGPPLWAAVVSNSHRLVVRVTTHDPVYHGCLLGEHQFAEVTDQKSRELYSQVA